MAHDPKRGAEEPESEAIRTSEVRTAHASSNAPDVPFAEPSGKRLSRARTRIAWLFEDLLDRYHAAGKAAFSRRNLAERYVGDSETIVRKWATGDKPMPLAALLLVPDEVFEDVVAALRAERRGGR